MRLLNLLAFSLLLPLLTACRPAAASSSRGEPIEGSRQSATARRSCGSQPNARES